MATALAHNCARMTDNRKDFHLGELTFVPNRIVSALVTACTSSSVHRGVMCCEQFQSKPTTSITITR